MESRSLIIQPQRNIQQGECDLLGSIYSNPVIDEAEVCGQEVELINDNMISKLPHRLIGAIISRCNGSNSYGTGILISRNLVLTCAHVIYHRKTSKYFTQFQFYPGQHGLTKSFCQVEKVMFPPQYTQSRNDFKFFDYALLKLKQPVNLDQFIALSGDTAGLQAATLSIIGYPAQKNYGGNLSCENMSLEQLSRAGTGQDVRQYGLTRKGYVLKIIHSGGLMVHRISTLQGQSGAPVIRLEEDKMSIAGIHIFSQPAHEMYKKEFKNMDQMNIARLMNNKLIQKLMLFAHRLRGEAFKVILQNEPIQPQLKISPQKSCLEDDYQVLKMKGKLEQDLKYIKYQLYNPVSIHLIFRASKHNFSAQAFHEHCDNIHDTFFLARTEYGKTLGGYSYYRWNEPTADEDGWINDSKRRAFLLQLDLYQKLTPVDSSTLIKCSSRHGPYFGGLIIEDKCNTRGCRINIGMTYDNQGPKKYCDVWNKKESFFPISGSKQKQCKIVEYEVYKILWE